MSRAPVGGRIPPFLPAVCGLLLACAGDGYAKRYADETVVAAVYAGRAPSRPTIERPPPLVAEYRLPDSVVHFRMQDPRAIAAAGPPSCEVAVADGTDLAVHLFETGGTYRRSVVDRGTPSLTASVASIALDRERLWVGYIARPYASVFDRRTGHVTRLDRVLPVEGTPTRAALTAAPEGTVLEHWFARSRMVPSASWRAGLPLVRWFRDDGALLGQGGMLMRYEGQTLTAALNWGFIAYANDTVWFARAFDARVFGLPLAQLGTSWPGLLIELPVAYHMARPFEYVHRRTKRAVPETEPHLSAFAAAPSGKRFVFGHVLAWGVRPDAALGLYQRSGELRVFDLEGEVREVRMPTDGLVVVLLRDSGSARVRTYSLPTDDGAKTSACVH